MQVLFSRMAQRLSSMLANTRGRGLTVSDLAEEYMLDGIVEQVLGRMENADPIPIEPIKGSVFDDDDLAEPGPPCSSSARSRSPSHPIIGRWVNFYPSSEPSECCSSLIVVSLSAKNARGSGHLKFEDAIERIILHAQGVCKGTTRNVVLITDSWIAKDHQKWASNLETIKAEGVQFEAYLIGEAGRCSQIDI